MTAFPKSRELIDIFVADLTNQFSDIKKTEVLRFTFNGQKYMVYFKCVSYAGNPYPQNTTRAQLPQRKEFDSLNDNERFLFLGYDINNDLFVCWDPTKAKSRLNKKKYVSFFCRQNIQDAVEEGNVSAARLTNGDVYVLFKRQDTARFFEMIEIHFPELIQKTSDIVTSEESIDNDVSNSDVEGRLYDVQDDTMVQALIDELIKEEKGRLTIVSECSNTFGKSYPAMFFKEWDAIVKKYISGK
ncbi:MAG: hypothetical protein MJZ34_15020 [Paludibacteraceae bacterium]|nr:hypothetical protein [Paludibacteraceae bacterium]